MSLALQIIQIVGQILAPLAMEMAKELSEGRDPLDVLVKERVAAILPEPLRLEAAQIAARARIHAVKS